MARPRGLAGVATGKAVVADEAGGEAVARCPDGPVTDDRNGDEHRPEEPSIHELVDDGQLLAVGPEGLENRVDAPVANERDHAHQCNR